jgi:hypothetical protein
MRRLVFIAVAAIVVGTSTPGIACNGGRGGGASSSGNIALASARGASLGGIALSAGSLWSNAASPAIQQAMLQQLAYQRYLQQQIQRQLLAQQQMIAQQHVQHAQERADQMHQAREEKLAQRKARAADKVAQRETARARMLAKTGSKPSRGTTGRQSIARAEQIPFVHR